MREFDHILKQYLAEQIGLEEHLYKVIEHQISEIDQPDFSDAKKLLIKTREVLERQFIPLNQILDKFEREAESDRKKAASDNGSGITIDLGEKIQSNKRISSLLRDDYSALNLITMSNTLLHTTALALKCEEVAEIALKHLENLAPLVVQIGALVPEIVARELHAESPKIDLTVAQIAQQNAQLAWRNSC